MKKARMATAKRKKAPNVKAPRKGEPDKRPPSRRGKQQRQAEVGGKIGPYAGSTNRPAKYGKFDAASRKAFLAAYAISPTYYKACEAANLCAATVSYWRKQDVSIDEDMELARLEYVEVLHKEIHRRGVEGVPEPVHYQGAAAMEVVPGTENDEKPLLRPLKILKYSDRMLELHVKKHDKTFVERSEVSATNKNTNTNLNVEVDPEVLVDFSNMTDDQLAAMRVLMGGGVDGST